VLSSPAGASTSITVTVCDERDVGDDGACDDILDTIAVAVDPDVAVDYVVFQLRDSTTASVELTGTVLTAVFAPTPSPTLAPVASAVPDVVETPAPAPAPTRPPTVSPTEGGLKIVLLDDDDGLWVLGATHTVLVQLTGIGDDLDTTYVDVYLYDAADDAKTPVEPVLAEGAEMTDGAVELAYDVPNSLDLTSARLRAIEYTYGYVAESDLITLSSSSRPTTAPAVQPTYLPSPAPTTAPPTLAPTTSRLAASLTVGAADLDAADVEDGTEITMAFAFSGQLERASAVLTLRVCEADDDHVRFNGEAADSPYSSCDPVADTILLGSAFDRTFDTTYVVDSGVLSVGSSYYIRADTVIDRDDATPTWALQNTYSLAFESAAFTVSFAATPAPTAPTAAPIVNLDSTSWFKTAEPSKDCAWAGAYVQDDGTLPRCDAKGDDGTFAYESCITSCADFVVP